MIRPDPDHARPGVMNSAVPVEFSERPRRGKRALRRLLEAHLASTEQTEAEARRLYEEGWRLEYGWNELSLGGTQVHRLKSPDQSWTWCDGEEPPAELAALGEAAEWLAQLCA